MRGECGARDGACDAVGGQGAGFCEFGGWDRVRDGGGGGLLWCFRAGFLGGGGFEPCGAGGGIDWACGWWGVVWRGMNFAGGCVSHGDGAGGRDRINYD